MSRIAIIPARGGSKRIPKKNIKQFLGRPIIAYSIEAALESQVFDEVMVSTDDEEIELAAKQFGAKVPFRRSNHNSDDYATTTNVLREVLSNYQSQLNKSFSEGCCLYPTAPFVSAKRLIEGLSLLRTGDYDSVYPIVKFSYPIWRALKVTDDQRVSMIWPENLLKRSQDLQPAYHDAGQWYWFKIERFVQSGTETMMTNNSYGLLLNELEVQDIDNEEDWKLAELKFQFRQKRN
ncbi:MAG: pseudaminic acid cytidylyltransferase [Cyclobacteriaceae bacterium]